MCTQAQPIDRKSNQASKDYGNDQNNKIQGQLATENKLHRLIEIKK